MQPSEYDIQREVEALRDIRRRSTTPGALTIDPDLPNASPPASPTTSYWKANATPSLTDGDSSSGSHDDDSNEDRSTSNPADDPFHLFWVPASLHPEIAPAEFRAFLKEHSRTPPADGTPTLERSNSNVSVSSGLGRKKSMLSRQYRPSENDNIEDEPIVSLRRNRSVYTNVGPQLTINDLQKLEELAEEASESADSTKLRNVLRRSLSLNMSPTAIDQMDDIAELGDEADAPIIVPPPGQILRRAARTKIRKPGLPGDGGGHRFGASRRGTAKPHASTMPTPVETQRLSSSSVSSSDHGDSADMSSLRTRPFSNESINSDATSIYDAYIRDDDEEIPLPVVVTSPPPTIPDMPLTQHPPESKLAAAEVSPPPLIHQPQPQRLVIPPSPPDKRTLSPSPTEDSSYTTTSPPTRTTSRSPDPPSFLTTSPSPQRQDKRKEDKKGLFGKWGGDKASKKSAKDKERENRERAEKEREKESGFFGSLFGSKKRHEEQTPGLVHGNTSGREAAQALLGASKSSKSYQPPPSPTNIGAANNYARYPIHVERAIYRLSHIKLANPRRPLYEQVLISNLMFWYLGVINKTQTPGTSPPPASQNSTAVEKEQKEKEQREKEEGEREKERLEREQKEKDQEMKKKETPRRGPLTKANSTGAGGGGRRAEMPVKGPQYEMQHRVMEQEYSGYNGPQVVGYNGQVMYNGQPPMGYASPPPGGYNGQGPGGYNGQGAGGYSGQPPPQSHGPPSPGRNPSSGAPQTQRPKPPPAHQQTLLDGYYFNNGPANDPSQVPPRSVSPQLPPGAMAPSMEQGAWMSSPPQSPKQMSPPQPNSPTSSSSRARRSRSPPPPPMNNHIPMPPPKRYLPPTPDQLLQQQQQEQQQQSAGGTRLPSRSLSATAVPAPHVNGKVRKNTSAYAAVPNGRRPKTSDGTQPPSGASPALVVSSSVSVVGEEEDVPLAVWQQQKRR